MVTILQNSTNSRFLGFPFALLVLLLLSATACNEKAPSGSTQADVARVLPTPPEQLKLYVFDGYIGNYRTDALMNLVFEGDTIIGSYYYFKNLGRLALNGNIDPRTNEVSLVESYKGKSTGYFKGQFVENGLIGQWSTDTDFNGAQDFNLGLFKVLEVGTKPSPPLTDASYEFVHGMEMWNTETKEFDIGTTTDDITIRFIDDTAFSFHYEVSGHNGHSGRIAGVGKMLNLKQGIFKGEENCELLFDFYDKKVDVTASGCHEYTGARASFGGSLTRK